MTSAYIARSDSRIAPRTDCSASSECGGPEGADAPSVGVANVVIGRRV